MDLDNKSVFVFKIYHCIYFWDISKLYNKNFLIYNIAKFIVKDYTFIFSHNIIINIIKDNKIGDNELLTISKVQYYINCEINYFNILVSFAFYLKN